MEYKESPKSNPIRVFDLNGAVVQKMSMYKREHCFSVKPKEGGRTYICDAETKFAQEQWVEFLYRIIAGLNDEKKRVFEYPDDSFGRIAKALSRLEDPSISEAKAQKIFLSLRFPAEVNGSIL